MYRKKSMIIVAMVIAVVIMAIGYAAFQTKLTINGTGSITSKWGIIISSVTTSITGSAYNIEEPTYSNTNMTFHAGFKKPGDKIVYEVTVKNNGTVDAILNSIEAQAKGSYALKYTLAGIEEKTRLGAGVSKTFTITIEFDRNMTSIPSDTSKELAIDLNYVQDNGESLTPSTPTIKEGTLASKILNDNTAKSDSGIDFSEGSSDTNGKGLYYTKNNTEKGQITYYFRGAVENNNVRFAGIDWKIVRINEDGSVRLITKDIIMTSTAFNTTATDNAYVGYMYGGPQSSIVYGDVDANGTADGVDVSLIKRFISGASTPSKEQFVAADVNLDGVLTEEDTELIKRFIADTISSPLSATDELRYEATHRNIFDSTLKKKIDEWYQTNLSSYSSYITDSGFCNDRSLFSGLGYAENSTYYRGHLLQDGSNPTFKCPNESRDLFTTSTSSKGNKALTYPIGLITADEFIFAGVTISGGSTYLPSTWTMTPERQAANAEIWLGSNGYLYQRIPTTASAFGASPVINIKGSAVVSSGNGTSSSPYVIKTS